MKTLITAVAIAAVAATSVFAAAPMASNALKTLAETGSAVAYAAEIGGTNYDKTGGSPAEFTYTVATPWQTGANALLKDGEFLAPHFAHKDGKITLMIAPHLVITETNRTIQMLTGNVGTVVKGIGPNDSFIVIDSDGQNAVRYDYSDDIAVM